MKQRDGEHPSSVTCGSATNISPGAVAWLREREPALGPRARRAIVPEADPHLCARCTLRAQGPDRSSTDESASARSATASASAYSARRHSTNPNPCSRRPRIGCSGTSRSSEYARWNALFASLPAPSSWVAATPRSVASAISSALRSAPSRRLLEQGQPRSVRLMHSRAQVPQRRFGGLGVVAQCGSSARRRARNAWPVPPRRPARPRHALVPARRRLCGGAGHAPRRRALVQHLAEQRVPERIRQLLRIARLPRQAGRRATAARARVASQMSADPRGVALEHVARACRRGIRPRKRPPRRAPCAARSPSLAM